uniref:ARAD1D15928p n=1 Tax=Blastobotrys adeninivorans TaxID=409370 RepID=A0A060TA18_BLAAD
MNLRIVPGLGHKDLPKYEPRQNYEPRSKYHHNPGRSGRVARNIVLSVLTLLCFVVFINDDVKSTVVGLGSSPVPGTENVYFYDLNDFEGHPNGRDHDERLLICVPLRNAEPVLPMLFEHLHNMTYPHHLTDLAFLVSDTDDNTMTVLKRLLDESLKKNAPGGPFNQGTILEKDFGQVIGQGFDDRHGVKVQGARRKLMGKARNWLLSASLQPYHTWVYWRDADIETAPTTIIEDLMKHNQDVIVPNVWRPLPEWLGSEQPYDLNSWQESGAALELAKTLDEDEVIVEGYAEYATWRPHLAYFRDANGNVDDLIELDGIGGVSILARSKVFRHGANFPGFAFENHAETEAFGKMSRKMGFKVGGLLHYTVWHQYEPSEDDLKKMKEMEEAKLKKTEKKKANKNVNA